MIKEKRGSITIEATLALTFFMFFMLTFLSFGKYYQVQTKVKHALNETALTMSFDNKVKSVWSNNKYVANIAEALRSIDSLAGSNMVDFNKNMNAYTTLWQSTNNVSTTVSHKMPKVETMNVDSAYELLTNMGLVVTISGNYTTDSSLNNTIKKQSIREGYNVLEGSTVTLTVYSTDPFFSYHPADDEDSGRVYVKNKALSIFIYYICGEKLDPESSSFKSNAEKILNKYKIKNVSFDNTQIVGNKLTLVVTYNIETGFSFRSTFGLPEYAFTDMITIALQK